MADKNPVVEYLCRVADWFGRLQGTRCRIDTKALVNVWVEVTEGKNPSSEDLKTLTVKSMEHTISLIGRYSSEPTVSTGDAIVESVAVSANYAMMYAHAVKCECHPEDGTAPNEVLC